MYTSELPVRTRWVRALLFAALVAVAIAAQLALHTVYVTDSLRGFAGAIVTVLFVAAGYGVARLMQPIRAARVLMCVALFAIGIFVKFEGESDPGVILLEARGERVQATIVELRISWGRRGNNVHYTVAGPDGERLPGEWSPGFHARIGAGTYRTTDSYNDDPYNTNTKPLDVLLPIGAKVPLVVDPGGLVHPQDPKVVAGHRIALYSLLIVGGIALLFGFLAGGPLSGAPVRPGSRPTGSLPVAS